MNAADKLRNELQNSSLIDKQKVLETVANGIAKNGGYSEVTVGYNPVSRVVYGSYDIECPSFQEVEAIKQYVISQGFKVRRAFHPISGREYGIAVFL